MSEHHITKKRMRAMKHTGIGCRELGHILACARCAKHLRDVFEDAGYLDRSKKHHSNCRCNKCRIEEQTQHYQQQYRKEHDMLTDDQIDAMGRKLAWSFLDYFKKQYGPPDDDRVMALHQKIDALDDRLDSLDEKFGQSLDEIRDASLDFEERFQRLANRVQGLEDDGAHTRAIAEEAEKEYVGVKAFENAHGLAGVVERLQAKVEKLDGQLVMLKSSTREDDDALEARHRSLVDAHNKHDNRIRALEESLECLDKRIIAGETSRAELRERVHKIFERVQKLEALKVATLPVSEETAIRAFQTWGERVKNVEEGLEVLEAQLDGIGESPVSAETITEVEQHKDRLATLESAVQRIDGMLVGKVQASGSAQRIEEKVDKILEIVDQLGEA